MAQTAHFSRIRFWVAIASSHFCLPLYLTTSLVAVPILSVLSRAPFLYLWWTQLLRRGVVLGTVVDSISILFGRLFLVRKS